MKNDTAEQKMDRLTGFVKQMICFMLPLLLLTAPLLAQGSDVDETAKKLPKGPSEEFFQPLVNAFGANLNSGWINNAPEAKFVDFTIKVGVVGMGAFIDPDEEVFQLLDIVFPFREQDARTLAAQTPGFAGLSPQEQENIVQAILQSEIMADVNGPTVFGNDDASVVVNTKATTIMVNGQPVTVPASSIVLGDVRGILNNPGIFPSFAPQLSVGTVYGTQATVRWLPRITIDGDVGDLKYFGFGVQHNPAVWFSNPLPVDLSFSFFTQHLEIGTGVLDVNTTAFGANVSKTFGNFLASVTPYAGFLIESSTMKADYDYEIAPGLIVPIQFELDGENKSRATVGLGASLLGINLFADYNFSNVNTASLTVMYGF